MGACLARLLSKESSRKTRFLQLAGEYADADPLKLLSPPESISSQDGSNLEKMVKAMISKLSDGHKAKIFLTFAVGQRESDASGYGPGTYFAAALSKKLWDEGVLCFSPLMLPDTASRKDFRTSWKDFKKIGSTLLVVKTAALYQDLECLKDIYTAQVNKIKVLPLRFDADVPDSSSEAWPQVTKEDLEEMLMVSALEMGFFQLNSIPSPPYTLPQWPQVMDEIVTDLKIQLFRKTTTQKRSKRDPSQSAVLGLLGSPYQCKGSTRNPEIRRSKLSSVGEASDQETPADVLLQNRNGGNAEEEGTKGDVIGQSSTSSYRPPTPLSRSKSDNVDEARKKAKKRREKAKGAETGEHKEKTARLNKAQTDNSHDGSAQSPSRLRLDSPSRLRLDDLRGQGAESDEPGKSPRLRPPDPRKLPKARGSGDREQRDRKKERGTRKPPDDRDDKKTVRA